MLYSRIFAVFENKSDERKEWHEGKTEGMHVRIADAENRHC